MNDPRTRSTAFGIGVFALVVVAVLIFARSVRHQFRVGAELRTRIDLNTASLEEIQAVPWIGPSRARAIVAYRDDHGALRNVDELLAIPGIGPVTLEAVREFVIVGEGDEGARGAGGGDAAR